MFNVKLAKEEMERLFRRANTHKGDTNTKEKGEVNNRVKDPQHFNVDPDLDTDPAFSLMRIWIQLFTFNADSDPDLPSLQRDWNLQQLILREP